MPKKENLYLETVSYPSSKTKLIKLNWFADFFFLRNLAWRSLGTAEAENTMQRLKVQSSIVTQLAWKAFSTDIVWTQSWKCRVPSREFSAEFSTWRFLIFPVWLCSIPWTAGENINAVFFYCWSCQAATSFYFPIKDIASAQMWDYTSFRRGGGKPTGI